MDKNRIFDILGIEETKDKTILQQAYRKQLVHHNPEDDPEGFKQLREAYEQACSLADREEAIKAQQRGELSAGDQWIADAEARYGKLSLRRDGEGWKQWLKEDYCEALDTAEEARERFLQFLLTHFYYPEYVWKIFDREFCLVDEKGQLLERYPENFVDYVVWSVQSGGFIDFDLFEGDDDADVDGYIRQYYELKYAAECCDETKADAVLQSLDTFGLHHVFVDAERMKLAMNMEKWPEVEQYLCLFEAREDSNSYIRLLMAAAYEKLDRWDEAKAVYLALLEEYPDLYAAGMGKARCLFHAGRYQEAKELTLDLLEISKNDEQGQQLMRRINECLIEDMTAGKDKLTSKELIDLGWCYLQNEQYEEALAIVESMEVDDKIQADFDNLAGRIYLYTQQEEKAFPYLLAWLAQLEAMDETDPKQKERKRRIPYAHFCLGICCQKFSESDASRMEEALGYMRVAIDTEKDTAMRLSYMANEAEWMNKLGRYEESTDICDRILEEDMRYLPAYVLRQEAAFKLHRGQQVIDDYYRIIELYPNYPQCYILAARMFLNYEHYDDALQVLEAAANAGLESDSLRYLKAKCRYYRIRKQDEMQEIADIYEELLQSRDLTEEEQEQLRIDLTECLIYLRDYKTALVRAERFMTEYPENRTLLWIRADVLNYLERYEDARTAYQEAKKYFPDNPGIFCDLARCLMQMGRYGEAITELEYVLKLNDAYKDANGLMMEAYHQLLLETDDPAILQKALPYADRQIELTPTEYDYIQRGILYQDAGEPEKALEDFLAALEKNPDSSYATNNLGFDYRLLDRFDEAVEMLERSIKLRKDQQLPVQVSYRNLAVTLLIMGNYRRAEEVLRESLKEGRNYSAELLLAEVYHRDGRCQEALRVYESMAAQYPDQESVLTVESAHVYDIMGDSAKGLRIVKNQYKKNKSDSWYFTKYAEYLTEVRRDYRKCLMLFMQEPKTEDVHRKIAWQHYYIEALWRTGRKKQAAKVLENMLRMLKNYGEERFYGIDNRPMNYFNVALCYLFGGRPEEAKKLIQRMLDEKRCRTCHYCRCFEGLYGMGYICLLNGNADEAFEYFKQALAVNPTDAVCRYYGKEKRKQL